MINQIPLHFLNQKFVFFQFNQTTSKNYNVHQTIQYHNLVNTSLIY